jgi:predicted ATPase
LQAGGPLEAAEFVCTNQAIHQSEVMELLSNLVDKSFVVSESIDVGRRYRLLETIRQYANEKLIEAGEASSHQRPAPGLL